ncbi:hypothetical protein GCM10026982_50120 [Nocardiopsis aegyptia]
MTAPGTVPGRARPSPSPLRVSPGFAPGSLPHEVEFDWLDEGTSQLAALVQRSPPNPRNPAARGPVGTARRGLPTQTPRRATPLIRRCVTSESGLSRSWT